MTIINQKTAVFKIIYRVKKLCGEIKIQVSLEKKDQKNQITTTNNGNYESHYYIFTVRKET